MKKKNYTLVDKFYVIMFGRWMRRTTDMFGHRGSLSLLAKMLNDLTKFHADRTGLHPEILMKDVLSLAESDLLTTKGGGS